MIFGTALQQDNDSQIDCDTFFEKVKIKKYYIDTDYKEVILSTREFQCLQQSRANYSSKAIAARMDLSTRTVEIYLTATKQKLNCNSKLELLQLLEKNRL